MILITGVTATTRLSGKHQTLMSFIGIENVIKCTMDQIFPRLFIPVEGKMAWSYVCFECEDRLL